MINTIIDFNWSNIFKKVSIAIPLFILLMTSMVYGATTPKIFPNQDISTSKTSWTIKFNSAVDTTSISNSTLYLMLDSTSAKFNCTYSFPDETTVIITSTTRLKYLSKYSIVVTGGVKSATTKKYLSIPARKTYTVAQNLVIDSVLHNDDVSVEQNKQPVLPSTVDVLYKDGTLGKESVIWSTVITSTPGIKKVTGKITGLTLTTSINVNVMAVEYLKDITVDYYSYLGISSVNVQAEGGVTRISINGIDMDYSGNNNFQISTVLTKGSTATFNAYDSSNKLLGTKKYLVEQ